MFVMCSKYKQFLFRVKLDIKEYSRQKQNVEGLWKGFQVEIHDGDWPDVHHALADISYNSSWATAEVPGADCQRLAEIAERMDKVLNLK